jgi:hypothetical protein
VLELQSSRVGVDTTADNLPLYIKKIIIIKTTTTTTTTTVANSKGVKTGWSTEKFVRIIYEVLWLKKKKGLSVMMIMELLLLLKQWT